jgi:hypothetical protein
MVDSSFYADGEVYDTAVVETNDHGASLTPSQAPSGFYPGGTVYNEADTCRKRRCVCCFSGCVGCHCCCKRGGHGYAYR